MLKRKPRRSREFKKNNQIIDFEAARRERQKRREGLGEKTRKKAAFEKKAVSKRGTSKKNRRRMIYAAILLAIIAVIGVSVFNVLSVRVNYEEELAKQAALLSEKQVLTEELANVDNPEYIEQQARTLLRMIRPGERLYVLPTGADEEGAD